MGCPLRMGGRGLEVPVARSVDRLDSRSAMDSPPVCRQQCPLFNPAGWPGAQFGLENFSAEYLPLTRGLDRGVWASGAVG